MQKQILPAYIFKSIQPTLFLSDALFQIKFLILRIFDLDGLIFVDG